MNEMMKNIWPLGSPTDPSERHSAFSGKYCLMASSKNKVLMFLLNCKDNYVTAMVDLLHDRAYKVEKLKLEIFIYYFNNQAAVDTETNKICFIAEDDNDFNDLMVVLERAA